MAAHPKPLSSMQALAEKAAAAKSRIAMAKRSSAGESIAAAKAKAHFLQLLDQVERDRKPITITKRGRVVAQLMPPPLEQSTSAFDLVFGSMKSSGKILGDIVSPDHEAWGPDWQ